MEIKVNFLDNLRLEAKFDDFTVIADQPIRYKGDGSAPGPFDYFLASSALCAAYFVKLYCQTRNIPTLGQVAEMAGHISYFENQYEFNEALAHLNEKQAKLNRVIVEAYGFAMENRFIFNDSQVRRPLQWMSQDALAKFPIDVEELEWTAIIAAMKKELSLLATARAA